jgi:hypothetical protein
MRTGLEMLMRGFRTGRIVDTFCELALKVWRENRMDCSTMSMARIPMMMICFGMDMKKWDHDHPRREPKHCQ